MKLFSGLLPRLRRPVMIVLPVLLAAGAAALFVWQLAAFRQADASPYFCKGVMVDGIHVGGKTWDEALELLRNKERQRGRTLLFALENVDARWFVDGGEVGSFNTGETLARAWAVGRTGPAWRRWMERTGVRLTGWRFESVFTLDRALLEARLAAMSGELYTAPVDARLVGFDTGAPAGERIRVRDEVPGYGLDVQATADACVQAFERRGWGSAVPVALGVIEAGLTADALRAMEPPRVSYGYRPDEYHALRDALRADCEAIGAAVLDPGDTYSLRQRLAAAGRASMELRAHLPTVLYGAALHAELTVLERHGDDTLRLPVAPGLEAVTDADRDLVLRNDTRWPMVLWVRADEGELVADIYRMPYEHCAYVRVIGVIEGAGKPRVYRLFCGENGRELGREPVEQD
ncbi:MAG: VanW family protein [Christensenellales bacterium]|jgi:hypothetical protein